MQSKLLLTVSVLVLAGLIISGGNLLTLGGEEGFLQGTWFDQLSVEGFPTLPMYCSYFTDLVGAEVGGTMLCSINRIELPSPMGTFVLKGTGHGAWIQTGSHEFAFSMAFFITNESGDLVGLSKIEGLKHLNEAMDRYTGEGTDDITDFNGNVMASSSWEVVGTKMTVKEPTK